MARSDFNVTADGFRDVARNLEKLKRNVQRKVTRGAVTKAMRPVAKSAKANAKKIKDTGLLSRSIGTRTKTYARSGVVISIVGAREGFRTRVKRKGWDNTTVDLFRKKKDGNLVEVWADPAKYAHLVELGTKPHGNHPGAAPKPYLRPAIITNRISSVNIFRTAMFEGMEREAKKLKVKR